MGYRFETELWKHQGDSAWYFMSVPFEVADEIDDITTGRTRGFGSVRVRVTIGTSTWDTSVFPDNKRETYLLPIKKQVRVSEKLEEGNLVKVELLLIDFDGASAASRSEPKTPA